MNQRPRRVVVVTGSRAEFGLLRFLMAEIAADPRLSLHVVATGMHLSTEFGLTYREIEAAGFVIAENVHMLLASDEPSTIAKSVGLGVIGFADALTRLHPEIVVVLGDRFEILAAAQAAMFLRIPIAHIHGGEASEGAIDEGIRHAITKMAHLHFTAAEPYRRRVIQLGEAPSRVFDFGAPGLDALQQSLLTKAELEAELEFELVQPLFVVTYHPATLGASPTAAVTQLFRALDSFPETRMVITKSNADSAGRAIGAAMDRFAEEREGRVIVRSSLGHRRYLSLMKLATVVIGNSSSGLIEAPALRVPTVNIGHRQDGRLKALSVIDCGDDAAEIESAIRRAIGPVHADVVRSMAPPYGWGNGASKQIKDVLATAELDGILVKRFYDLPEEQNT